MEIWYGPSFDPVLTNSRYQVFIVERLIEHMVSAPGARHCRRAFDRDAGSAPGDDKDGRVRADSAHPLEKVDAVQARHPYVCDHQIEGTSALTQT